VLALWSASALLLLLIFTILCFINSLSLTVCYLNVWLVGHFLTGAVLLLFLRSFALLLIMCFYLLLRATPICGELVPRTPPFLFCYLKIPPLSSLFVLPRPLGPLVKSDTTVLPYISLLLHLSN
jgi:hypothetical protein